MATFTVFAPNSVTQYDSLQAAVSAAPVGAIVRVPLGVHILDRLVIPRTIRLEGEFAYMQARPAFNDGGWGAAYNYGQSVGSVLVFTCTDGNAIDFTGSNEGGLYGGLSLADLCIVGSGGTATGLALGSLTNQKGRIQLATLSIGNFKVGLKVTGIYSGGARDVVISGCETGLSVHGNALAFDNLDIRSCTTGVMFENANLVRINGGAIQGCDTGVDSMIANENSVNGVYFEGNTTATIHLSATANHNHINRCHYSTVSGSLIIDGANNRIDMADITTAPVLLNGQSNILYDGQYGSPTVTLGQFGNYREYMLPMTYANVGRFLKVIEGGNATRDGVFVKGCDVVAQSNGIMYKVTPGIIPL